MTIGSEPKVNFTPELLISAPRPTPAVPNDDGSLALFTTSSYSIEANVESNEIKILDLNTRQVTLFSDDNDIKQPQWFEGNRLLWLRSPGAGKTQIWIGTAGAPDKNASLVGTIDSPISQVKTKILADKSVVLAFCAPKSNDGSLFNPENAPKPNSSAREYDTSMVRYWDTWYRKERSSLWYSYLFREGENYRLSDKPPVNVLAGSKLQFPWTPTEALGEGGSYDISPSGVIFDTLNIEEYDPTFRVTKDLWFFPFAHGESTSSKTLKKIVVPGWNGSSTSGAFSPDGKLVAFLKDKEENPEFQFPSIFVLELEKRTIGQSGGALGLEVNAKWQDPSPSGAANQDDSIFGARAVAESWDRSPTSLHWSNNGRDLLCTAEEHGRVKLFKILHGTLIGPREDLPIPCTENGSVAAVYPLNKDSDEKRFLVTTTNMVDSAIYTVINIESGDQTLVLTATDHGRRFGLSPDQIKEFHYQGAGNETLQSWLVYPPTFKSTKRYPVAFVIHGGPVSSWTDRWFTRWNAATFASQDYILVMPNITGSTGFGRSLTEAVRNNWSGRPYEDIVKCVEHVEKYDFVDPERFVALGASYGGYMMNWIAGKPLAKRFRCLVCHDGIFSLPSILGDDLTVGAEDTFGGTLWDNPEGWKAADPARHTRNWTQPMLIIHSDGDFRCLIEGGLAAYYVCKLRGIPARLLNFPNENHFVLGRANSLHWYRTVLGWINKWAINEGDGRVELQRPATEP